MWFFLFVSCVTQPQYDLNTSVKLSEDTLFEDWSQDWSALETGWSQSELTKEERLRLKSDLEVVYFDRIVPYKKQLHIAAPRELLEVELAFGRLLYDLEYRRSRKISEKTADARKKEMVDLKEDAHQLLKILSEDPNASQKETSEQALPQEDSNISSQNAEQKTESEQ